MFDDPCPFCGSTIYLESRDIIYCSRCEHFGYNSTLRCITDRGPYDCYRSEFKCVHCFNIVYESIHLTLTIEKDCNTCQGTGKVPTIVSAMIS